MPVLIFICVYPCSSVVKKYYILLISKISPNQAMLKI